MLHTGRLLLTPVAPGDHAELRDHWGDPEVYRFLFDATAPSDADVRAVIEDSRRTFGMHGYGVWLIREHDGGRLLGTVALRELADLGLEVVYSLDPAGWGRGYATEAAGAVVEYAFGSLGLTEVLAEVDEGNTASAAVVRRLGMVPFDVVPGELGPMTRYRRVAREVRRALVRRPGPRLADGLVTHIARTPVDAGLALRQWQDYVAALAACGWDCVEVPPADRCPDAVFVEDAVMMFGELAVLARPGAEVRRPEVAAAGDTVAGLGYRTVSVEPPGTLDGGDVLKIGDTVYVGHGGRTNDAGIGQLRDFLAPEGWRVVPVAVNAVLHLKSAVTALPDGTVIGYPPLVDRPEAFPAFLPVPEPAGAHVVLLGGDRLLMAASAPATAAMFAGLGYRPVPVDISEFERLEGCVTCLSVRLRRPPDPRT